MEKYCISVDWLQTYCLGDVLESGTYGDLESRLFWIKEDAGETAMFKRRFSVYSSNIKVATILQCPRSSVINRKATLVKLENRVLYSTNYISLLYDLQKTLKLYYKGITRLDLCYDCNFLKGGRKVDRFIKDFVMSEMGQLGHIVRKGSARFSVHGTKKQTSASKFNSISWGSPKSKIRCYCYDKTLELIEVKDKPWIREVWKQNGLECEINYEQYAKTPQNELDQMYEQAGFDTYINKHVWRFEISIGSEGQDILNMSTGELFRLSPHYLENQKAIEKLFYLYAEKVFNFRINTGQKQIRNYKRLELFEMSDVITAKPIYINKFLDSGRAEKTCYNKLRKLSEEYSDIAEQKRNAIVGAMEFLAALSGKKSELIRMHKNIDYLNELKAHKFLDQLDVAYLGALDSLNEAKKDYDPETLWECFAQSEFNEYWEKIERDKNVIPPEEMFYSEYMNY